MTLETPNNKRHARLQRTPHNSISIPADYPAILASLRGLAFLVIAPPEPLLIPLSPLISSLKLHPVLEAALHIRNMDIASAKPLLQNFRGSSVVSGHLERKLLQAVSFRLEGDMERARLGYKEACEAEVKIMTEREREDERLHQLQDPDEQEQKKLRLQNNDSILCSVWGRAEDVRTDTCQLDGCDGVLARKHFLDKARNRAVAFADSVENWRERAGSVAEEMELGEMGSREWERIAMLCERRFGTGMWADAGAEFMKGDARMGAGEALVRVGDGF